MEPRASTALTAVGLAALRRAAVMAHTVGTISLRLTAGDEQIVDVRPGPAGHTCSGRTVDPCGFRMAVARAWADHELGREIGLIGLGPTDALDIDWSVAAPGQDLGFGAVRAVCAGRVVWAFASVLDPLELSSVMAEMDSDHDDIVAGVSDGIAARLVHDELLGATVIHVEADPPVSTRVLDEVLRRMVAVVGAAELTRELT
jgi:hypothetical protein